MRRGASKDAYHVSRFSYLVSRVPGIACLEHSIVRRQGQALSVQAQDMGNTLGRWALAATSVQGQTRHKRLALRAWRRIPSDSAGPLQLQMRLERNLNRYLVLPNVLTQKCYRCPDRAETRETRNEKRDT
jgi:hypothetical protein